MGGSDQKRTLGYLIAEDKATKTIAAHLSYVDEPEKQKPAAL